MGRADQEDRDARVQKRGQTGIQAQRPERAIQRQGLRQNQRAQQRRRSVRAAETKREGRQAVGSVDEGPSAQNGGREVGEFDPKARSTGRGS